MISDPEIRNTHVWVLPNIWRLRRVRDIKFGTNVSDKILLNAAKSQGYRFYRFWVIKGKPTGGKITPSPPPRLALIIDLNFLVSAVITQIFNPTKEFIISIEIPTKERKVEIETTTEAKVKVQKIGKC